MAEQYTTLGASTLAAGIDGVQLTLTVVSAATLPALAIFRLRIGDEIVIVTSAAAAPTYTITRGAEGTAAVAHSAGALVTEVMTAAQLDAIRVDIHATGAIAALPAAPRAGDTFYPSDAFYKLRYSGGIWERWGAIWKLTEPDDATFAWRNQGTATKSVANGGVYVQAAAAAGTNLKGREIVAPATPYVVTAAFLANLRGIDFASCGLYFANNGAGTISTLAIVANSTTNSGWIIQADKLTSAVLFSALYAFEPFPRGGVGLVWFRIADDGVNRVYSYSGDGHNFLTFFSVARADFLTADRVGFKVESGQATAPAGIALLHWVVT
jgi:hypothetical protein